MEDHEKYWIIKLAFPKVNSQGSGRQKPSPRQIPKVGEDNE